MKIRFYGRLADLIGREAEVALPDTDATVGDLRQLLATAHPSAAEGLARGASRACVDDHIVGEDFCLREARCVELFPPLSGG